MDTSSFDAQISDLDSQIEAQKAVAETAAVEFMEEVGRFLADWAATKVEGEVKSKPEITKSLGLEKIKELKADLQRLCADYPNIAKQFLNDDKYWSHRAPITPDIYYPSFEYEVRGNSAPRKLDEPIGELLSHCAKLLNKYGFLTKPDDQSWRYGGDSNSRWRMYCDWSDELKQAIGEYVKALSKLGKIVAERRVVEDAKEKAEAADLWSQA